MTEMKRSSSSALPKSYSATMPSKIFMVWLNLCLNRRKELKKFSLTEFLKIIPRSWQRKLAKFFLKSTKKLGLQTLLSFRAQLTSTAKFTFSSTNIVSQVLKKVIPLRSKEVDKSVFICPLPGHIN